MVIGNGREDAGFLEARLLDQRDVIRAGPDPAGDLRIAQTEVLALLHGLAILSAVEEELRLPDHAVRSAETAHQGIEIHDLLDGVRGSCLLSVAEGRIGYEDLLRGTDRDDLVVEIDPAYLVIGEHILLEVGFFDVLEIELPELGMLVVQHLLIPIPFCHVSTPPVFLRMPARPRAKKRAPEIQCPRCP